MLANRCEFQVLDSWKDCINVFNGGLGKAVNP